MSNIFCGWTWMKVGKLSQMGGRWCQITKQLCSKDTESLISCFFFFAFGFVLLFCRLLCLMLLFNGAALVS
jgi:hypothetical protein